MEKRPRGLLEHSEHCDVLIIAYAEIESFRGPWADYKVLDSLGQMGKSLHLLGTMLLSTKFWRSWWQSS